MEWRRVTRGGGGVGGGGGAAALTAKLQIIIKIMQYKCSLCRTQNQK